MTTQIGDYASDPSAGSGPGHGQRSKMKIIHVVDSMELGGAEMLVALLCRWQRSEGHTPAVYCLLGEGKLAEQLKQEGIPVRLHDPALGFPGKLRLIRNLCRNFKTERPDVVHCHNTFATVMAAPPARWAGVGAVVTTRHGLASPPWTKSKANGMPGRLGDFVRFRFAAACCDRVVAVCDVARRNLEFGPAASLNTVVTIRNGAFPAPVSSVPDPSLRKEGFTLISVARLDWKKNQISLLRAVALARRQVSDLRLLLVGGGLEEESLRNLASHLQIESCVRFAGERMDVGDCLSQADLFVLSSLTEGMPVSLIEAMAAGLPFIVTNVGGMPEVAELSAAGTVVEPNNPQALAEAIISLAARRNDLPERGRKARECYEQHFTPSRMANSYICLYRECLGRTV